MWATSRTFRPNSRASLGVGDGNDLDLARAFSNTTKNGKPVEASPGVSHADKRAHIPGELLRALKAAVAPRQTGNATGFAP